MHAAEPFASIAQGGATGADTLARKWCEAPNFVQCRAYRAQWKKHGKAAGPIRNGHMLFEEQPDVVIAFPGGDGTADCVRQAHDMGFKVIEIEVPAHVH